MLFYSLLLSFAFALPPRITELGVSNVDITPLLIRPGLITVLEFPATILEVRIGNPQDLKAIISQVSPKELTLYFNKSLSQPTNLIVRAQKKIYVFDIIPSHSHQDYLKIKNSFTQQLSTKSQKTIKVGP